MTAVQAEYVRGLGGVVGGGVGFSYMAGSRILGEEGARGGGQKGASRGGSERERERASARAGVEGSRGLIGMEASRGGIMGWVWGGWR